MVSSDSESIKNNEVWPAEIDLPTNNWIFPVEFFEQHSPSRVIGMRIEDELKLRYKAYKMISQIGVQLKLQGQTILDSTIFLHRYYMRHSITSNFAKVAATCVFIACKVEENHRKVGEIVQVAAKLVYGPTSIIDSQSPQYWEWVDDILYREDLLLQQLCFDLYTENIYDFLKTLHNSFEPDNEKLINDTFYLKRDEILKNALRFIEEWSCLPIFSLFTHNTIIATAIITQVIIINKKLNPDARTPIKGSSMIKLPDNFIKSTFDINSNSCYELFRFLVDSFKVMVKEGIMGASLVLSLSDLTKSDFLEVTNEK